MSVQLDMINTGSWSEGPDGVRAEVVAKVSNVTGDTWARRGNALRAQGLPAMGSAHPADPSIVLLERNVEPVTDSPSQWIVRMLYRRPAANEVALATGRYGPTTWSGDVTTVTERTSEDINGRPMRATYRGQPWQRIYNSTTGRSFVLTGLDVRNLDNSTDVQNFQQIVTGALVEVDVQRPTSVTRADRYERDDPEPTAERLTGTVNSRTFRRKAPATVLCRGVRWQQTDEGYTVSYEFAWNPAGWRARGTAPVNGRLPEDARVGNGIEFFDVYPLQDFLELNL